jgi:hypothetical protein
VTRTDSVRIGVYSKLAIQNNSVIAPIDLMNSSSSVQSKLYNLYSISSDDYKQIMTSNIGAVRPSRNSIVTFLKNPQDLFAIGNPQTIFDDDDFSVHHDHDNINNDSSPSCSSMPSETHFPDKIMSSKTREKVEVTKSNPAVCYSQEGFPPNSIQKNIHENLAADCMTSSESDNMPQFTSVSSSAFSSKSGANLLPDSYAEPVDESLFSDLSEESHERSSYSINYELFTNKNSTIDVKHMGSKSQTIDGASRSLLHQACYLYPRTLSVVNTALTLEKSNLRNRIFTPERTATATYRTKRIKRDPSLTLPLHIVLQHNGSWDVIQCLTLGAPDVIAMKDGPNECNAISVMLYQKRFDSKILSFLVQQYPQAIQVVDRYHNTSLHVACAQGAPLEVVEILYMAFPKALEQTNILGLKPLQVAQQMSGCSMDVIDFLQDLISSPLEEKAIALMDQDFDVPR